MRGWRKAQTAAGQASVLFTAAGALGLLSELAPEVDHPAESRIVSIVAITAGLIASFLPWERWSERATLVLLPGAFGLIIAGQWFDPTTNTTLYGLWFLLVFGWIGSWHPARTALYTAPLAAAVYVVPFLPGSPAESSDSLSTVVIAIPIAVVLAEVLAAKASEMRRAQRALEASAELLERANLTDDLTGVGNRRMANMLLDTMEPGDGLILLDLDHFKVVNDTLGHAAGDRVLMWLGSYLLNAVRDADTVARYGGEEFLVLVRDAEGDLEAVAERLLAGWRACGSNVTLSAGAALHAQGRGPSRTFKLTDRLLYQAKAAGRDRVVSERTATDVRGADPQPDRRTTP